MASQETSLGHLRRRAELALERRSHGAEAETLLQQIVDLAAEGSDDSVFAHRHLAELRLERHPWRAALHLRRVLAVRSNDDVPHALMGLCQALLGNYRVAATSYRRALQLAPSTACYHHNLGHLLDVALEQPRVAEPHLRQAFRLEPEQDEILASLAHCLAHQSKLDEAYELACEAMELAPEHPGHRRLATWIERGASMPFEHFGADVPSRLTEVSQLFESQMADAGFSADQVDQARALWRDFRQLYPVRLRKPAVYAAAVEYAIAKIHRRRGLTQAMIARRYGIAAKTLSSRYARIRTTLELQPDDPRYGTRS